MEKSPTSSNDPNIPEYQRRFMDALENFMEQCYVFIETQQSPPLTEEERIAKIKAITSLIQEKEKELTQLEAQRTALNSFSTVSQKSAQKSAQEFQCEPDCPADCSFIKDKSARSASPSHRNP